MHRSDAVNAGNVRSVLDCGDRRVSMEKESARELLRFAEEHIRAKGGRLLIAETSSTPKYEKTRAFYERKGFERRACIKDYYKPGDDLIIYGKYL